MKTRIYRKRITAAASAAPDVGETMNQLASSKPGTVPASDLTASKDGFVFFDQLSPAFAHWMYERSRTKVTEVRGSHLVYVSQPRAVARVIEAAALAAR